MIVRDLVRYLLFALMLPLIVLLPAAGLETAIEPCEGSEPSIVVDTLNRTLWMCRGDRAEGEFRVSLGGGGVEKRMRGDKKTPLGEYTLGEPRPSENYLIFIPVGYPSDSQKEMGFSGGNIGIHGPHRDFLRLRKYSVDMDWTLGCIAVGADSEIEEIARWVQGQKAEQIFIR